jgi:hypothetical protein
MVVCNGVVYNMVVLLVVRELTTTIAGDSVGFSGIFLKGERLWVTVFHEVEMEVPTSIADNSHENDGKHLEVYYRHLM